ncbi:MAG: hypothetical protein V3U91_01410, partial [Candidatus Aminicenantaceae bacterium]
SQLSPVSSFSSLGIIRDLRFLNRVERLTGYTSPLFPSILYFLSRLANSLRPEGAWQSHPF